MFFPLLLLINTANCEEFFKFKRFDIEYQKSIGTNRTPLLPSDRIKKGVLSGDFETEIGKYGYNTSKIESYISDRQFSYIGLKTEFGINIDRLQIFMYHYSGHCMDCIYDFKYPNENSIGIRFNLYKR